MKIIRGERLDKPDTPLVNCAGCSHKVGRACSYHHALLQSNPHKPTDCEHWKFKEVSND